jgi:hypothetical protein
MKILSLILVLASCSHIYSEKELSIADRNYVRNVKKMDSTLVVNNDKSQIAWKRGLNFIKNYSFLDIESKSNSHVSTKDPNAIQADKPGYVLTRAKKNGKTVIKVRCMYPTLHFKYTEDLCKANERYMTYYMKTGKLMSKFVNTVDREDLRSESKGLVY